MSKYQGVSTLEILTGAKKYNKWISDKIFTHLSPPALEIGAGIGNITQLCLEINPLYASDCDEQLVKGLKKKFKKKENIFVETLDITKTPPEKFTGFFSSIFAVNVLEHIEDDMNALKNIHTMMKKNGKLILLVPAKKFAYTRLDHELGHFRRYEKKELEQKLINNGYKIETIKFFNILGLLSWYVRDKVNRRNFALKPYQIKLFDNIVPLLRVIESIIKIPAGISLIVIARRV